MTNEELGKEIALGIINTGVEGGYDALSCSTAGDYPSMGVSQWEGLDGGRGDTLLSYIDGGDHFAGRTYSDIEAAGELDALSELLGSEQGQQAQQMILAQDCTELYADTLTDIDGFDDSRAIIYAGIWCPTSHVVVSKFIEHRRDRGEDVNDLYTIYNLFHDEYAHAAGCDDYEAGYQNRATNTYDYVRELDLSAYGVPVYD